MYANLYMQISEGTIVTLVVLGLILAILLILLSFYGFIVFCRMDNAAKKIDYFFEDLTYKSEMLNSTVETVAKLSNYVDVLDAFTKRNVKSWVKVATKNKDLIYKLVDKLREFAQSDDK